MRVASAHAVATVIAFQTMGWGRDRAGFTGVGHAQGSSGASAPEPNATAATLGADSFVGRRGGW